MTLHARILALRHDSFADVQIFLHLNDHAPAVAGSRLRRLSAVHSSGARVYARWTQGYPVVQPVDARTYDSSASGRKDIR